MKFSCSILIVGLILPMTVVAHPGRTASDGCHYCRTNCASWGEVHGARHCHGGGGGGYRPAPTARPTCPANAYENGGTCTCTHGYAPSLDKARCITIPANAHAGNGVTDVWECNSGYRESGNTCIPEPIPDTAIEVITKEGINETVQQPIRNAANKPSVEELEKRADELQKEIREIDKEKDGSIGSFLLGVVSVVGGYWFYRKRKKPPSH